MTGRWQERAACLGAATEYFYPEDYPASEYRTRARIARSYCLTCPVQLECLRAGESEPHGIWGGMTPRQRQERRWICRKCGGGRWFDQRGWLYCRRCKKEDDQRRKARRQAA